MVSETGSHDLYEKLLNRRQGILKNVHQLDQSRLDIDTSVFEYEERANIESTLQSLKKLDERERKEIHLIDKALKKMDQGGYGQCESCGQDIALERLESLPWTTLCVSCSKLQEEQINIPISDQDLFVFHEGDRSEEVMEMTEEELEEFLYEKIYEDNRIETSELEIYCQEGKIFLEGEVFSEVQYQLLFEILSHYIRIDDIEDNLRITYQEWSDEDNINKFESIDKTDEERLWDRDEDLWE